MGGSLRFSVALVVKDKGLLPELEGRAMDLSPAFDAIIPEWSKLNEDKFDEGRGLESSGAQIDELVFWSALKPNSSKAKRRKGHPDWIMVETGDLRRALMNPDLIFTRVSAQDASFGTPLNMEEADKVRWQWLKRQAIFLSTVDKNTINRIVQDYFSFGPGFKERRFAKGLDAVKLRKEVADMDTSFRMTV